MKYLKENKLRNKCVQQITRFLNIRLNDLSESPHYIIILSFIRLTLIIVSWILLLDIQNIILATEANIFKKNTNSIQLLKFYKKNTKLTQKINLIPLKISNTQNISKAYVYRHTILVNETLSKILNKYGVKTSNIKKLTKVDRKLNNLQTGQYLTWMMLNGNIKYLIWGKSSYEIIKYNLIGNVFKIQNLKLKNVINIAVKGIITNSFSISAKNAGLNNKEINAIIKIMQYQTNLQKFRKGDQYSILISRKLDNGKYKQSQIIGLHFRSGGKEFFAIRAKNGEFYDLYGNSVIENGFLRFPMKKQFRISSNFNPNRLNPITGKITPHSGIDFAMPQDTPVLVVGDGVVIVAKHNNAAGFYIAVRHGRIYTTRYMHLHKMLVKPIQKVKRGEPIGLSGNTGRSTGPHLHYEVLINHQAVNPLTAKLPYTDKLTGKYLCDYIKYVKTVMPQLQLINN